MFIAAVTTAGDMTYLDIQSECGKEGWVPLIVYQYEGATVLPIFKNERICKDWIGRNISKKWKPNGCCFLTKEDMEFVEDKNWNIKFFEWPNKIKGRVDFRVEVVPLKENPSVHAKG